ncbi:MAG TPA: CoA transferase [Dehalococcoidia bacterium]|nr:CoA transferase [Dehalococcoidia bacterium]
MAERLLAGLRVIELAQEIAGPYGGKLLADLGADVIKVEPPAGDLCRARGPFPGHLPHRERSGLFRYLNSGKRGVAIDLEAPSGREAVFELCRDAGVLLESFAPGEMARLGLDITALLTVNPRLALVSVTPFGQTGPQAAWRGNDLIAFHASGMAFGFPALQVDRPDLPPHNAPSYGAAFLAGELVAAAAMHGLHVVQRRGRGCHLDLSLQEAVAALNQSQYSALERTGEVRRRFSSEPSNPTVALLPCADGWVAISPREEHQWQRWLEVMGSPAWGAEPRFADRRARERHWRELYPLLAAWSGERATSAVFEAAQAARVACYPLGRAADLLASPQLQARGFFVEIGDSGTGPLTVPGTPYRIDGEGSRAPVTGDRAAEAPRSAPPSLTPSTLPLAGVRIVDFSWVLTGPICTKYLAALGAEVIKIESRTRPDLSQRDLAWEELNPSKRSITLNLQHEAARDLARRLIAQSDAVIENFSSSVMERLGLGYAALREQNPRLVMLSSSALGRSGPERDRVAYGTLIQCFTGWAGLAAHPGLPPRSAAGIWTDPLTAAMATYLLLAALWRQRRHGEGCYIDLSMAETTIAALPEPLLAWGLNRELLAPRGNRDPLNAPQGCYAAAGDDRWLALSVQSDADWTALCRLMAREELLDDARLATAAGRWAHADELDATIAAWVRPQAAEDCAARLQAAGIAATPTLTPADVLSDAHLAARAFISPVERLEGGTRQTLGFPWLADGERPGQFRRPPAVGEDNAHVFRQLLKLDTQEYARLVAEHVIY